MPSRFIFSLPQTTAVSTHLHTVLHEIENSVATVDQDKSFAQCAINQSKVVVVNCLPFPQGTTSTLTPHFLQFTLRIEYAKYTKNPQIGTNKKEAEASKCIELIAGWEKYLEYIDNIFTNTKSGWEWYKLEKLNTLAEKLKIDKSKFSECMTTNSTTTKVEKEFVQWRMLWIQSVPSSLIINNDTWEYKIVSEVIDDATLEWIISEISK